MNYWRFFLLGIFTISMSFSSCKKDNIPDECASVLEAPKEYLDYWYFPSGSWWVYKLKDSLPAVYDTVKVTLANSTYFTPNEPDRGGARSCLRMYNARYEHSNATYFPGGIKPGYEIYNSLQDGATSKWYIQQESYIFSLHSPDIFFVYPFLINETLPGGAKIVDTNQVTTPLSTFNNIVHIIPDFGNTIDSTSRDYVKHFYYSSNIGLVKIIYTNNKTWELINYNINF